MNGAREESRMRRRKGRPPNVGSAEFLDNTDAKLLRKLQAQAPDSLRWYKGITPKYVDLWSKFSVRELQLLK